MSDIIKVHDLPAISRYSTAVQEFSKNVDSASQQTMREFDDKIGRTEGDEDQGAAINAFLERLNRLQQQVFHEFPTTITHFSTALSQFENSATSAGFQKKAWTQQLGNDTVYQKLNGEGSEQYEKVETKANDLQVLLDAATNKLGIEAEDLTSVKTNAGDQLSQAATARRATHDALQGAHDTLSQSVTEVEGALGSLQGQINSARAFSSVPAPSILEGIKNGSLKKNKMSYFDSIQTEADGRALGAVLSKKPEEILKEEPETLSKGFYLIGSQEMMEWISSEDEATLNRLLDAMGGRDFSANAPFLKGFQQAGITLGDTLEELMKKRYGETGELHSEQMNAYNKKLALADKFVGLMESLYVMEIGTVKTSSGSLHNGGKLYNVETTTKVRISDITDATFSFQTTVDTKKTTLEKNSGGYIYPTSITNSTENHSYSMEEYATAVGNNMAEKQGRVGELEVSRKQAEKELATALVKGAAYSALGVFIPEVVPIVSMIDSLAVSDGAKFGKQFGTMMDKGMTIGDMKLEGGFTKTGFYNFGLVYPAESLQNYAKYIDKLSDYDLKEEGTRVQMIDDFLNRGNTYLFKTEGKASAVVSRFQPHNFYSVARLGEMDSQGIVPYVEYAKTSGELKLNSEDSAKEIIQATIDRINANNSNDETEQVSSEMCKYLLGEDTDLSLLNMTTDQLETYKTVLEELPISAPKLNLKHGYEEYQWYMGNKF